MSKEAAMRAMREAKFNARSTTSTTAAKKLTAPAKSTKPAAADPAPDVEGLCGHRSMNGRTCTREKGHSAKSHRYS
ncbi:hypothetical protein F0U44_05200 [Nocardioides humilatus]|uniref:Uncharacterized protein n=1 Tax=Nocardioides humilatus TaxID=2607660 RepID=A0A5B1LLS7_9ACTN|nr:hypothetical protein [Nocardioides humilatus]KAA1421672.1 hypothetical protein F0U44_05200 [Nocardioides humilatus]